MGCAFSPDGRLLYFGSADSGEIKVLDVASSRVVASIPIDGDGFEDSFVGDFVLDASGTRLYVLDQFNYRLVTVDVARRRVVQSVRVGRNPFSITLSPDERTAWVTNVGMFEYPLLPGVTKDNRSTAGLTFPAYGVPSKEAEEGTVAEGLKVPGLGDPNHPDAMSVFAVDLATGNGACAREDGVSRWRDARRDEDNRRRQSGWCRRGRAVRLRVERDKRHGHRARCVERLGPRGDSHRRGAQLREAARHDSVRRRAES